MTINTHVDDSPAEYTKNEVHDEEGSENNHWYEIYKHPWAFHGILDLFLLDEILAADSFAKASSKERASEHDMIPPPSTKVK